MNYSSAGGRERMLAPSDAVRLGMIHLEAIGIRPKFEEIGTGFLTTHCKLHGDRGIEASGIGKGIGDQSKASALFEAIEHYYWFRSGVDPLRMPKRLDLKGTDKALALASPDFNFICGGQDVYFSRALFEPLDTNLNPLSFPFFLTNPFWESPHVEERLALSRYTLRRYSSNSGTAAGITPADARLHALLEVIERDAIGIELLRTVVHRRPSPVRRVTTESLPSRMQWLIAGVSKQNAEILGVFNITAMDLEVPVILVGLRDTKSGRRCYGTGASLSSEYAFERALLEALQSMHVWRGTTAQVTVHNVTTNSPAFLRCAIDRGYFGYVGGEVIQEFGAIPQRFDITQMPIEGQITALCERLRAYSMKVYVRSLHESSISVQQVVVPELERFHIVTAGIPVLPGPRGRLVLE